MNDQPGPEPKPLTPRVLLLTAAILTVVAIVVGGLCCLIGPVRLSGGVLVVRFYRILAAAAIGASLAVAGMALQGMLRNPLAEPYILGISSGAGVGVLVGTALLGRFAPGTPVLAMFGALATCIVVYTIAQRGGRLDPYVLLLAGVCVTMFNGAIMFSLIIFLQPDELLRFVRWGMGDVPQWVWWQRDLLAGCGAVVLAGWALLLVRGAAMNALGLGDDVAASSGVSVHRLRVETFIVVSLMTAAAVSLAGPVGFVGLIVPHICRLIVGPDHRRLALYSGFVGAIFLMVADTFCRTFGPWVGVGKIPVGVVTALCGAPFFIFLLRRRAGEAGK